MCIDRPVQQDPKKMGVFHVFADGSTITRPAYQFHLILHCGALDLPQQQYLRPEHITLLEEQWNRAASALRWYAATRTAGASSIDRSDLTSPSATFAFRFESIGADTSSANVFIRISAGDPLLTVHITLGLMLPRSQCRPLALHDAACGATRARHRAAC